MGKTFSVDPQVLLNASTTIEGISNSYSDIAQQLMQKAQTMGAAWDSEDNLAYVSQITGFTDDLKAMAAKLMTASQTLKQQSTNYTTRKDDNISSVKKLAN